MIHVFCVLTPQLMGSVGFYQMAKIAVTPTIVLAEFILFRKTISFNKVGEKLLRIFLLSLSYFSRLKSLTS